MALLIPGVVQAQAPKPAPGAPDRPNFEQMREELRDLPPEERQARIREIREQFAQRQGQPGGQPLPGQARGQGMMAGGPAANPGRVMMVLTPEQRESMREVSEANRDKVRDLEEKLRVARKAATDAGIGQKFDEAALREKLEAAAKLDIELTLLRAKALASIEPPLSEEQIQKIRNPAPMNRDQPGQRGPGFDGPGNNRPPQDQPRPGQPPPPRNFERRGGLPPDSELIK